MSINERTPESLISAIKRVCEDFCITIPEDILEAYLDGKLPSLLSYEKVEKSEIQLPVIIKYLIGAKHNTLQPRQYYDIFRATRHCTVVELLDVALRSGLRSIKNVDERILELCRVDAYDAFDAILFELLTANRYRAHPEVLEVRFLPVGSSIEPDIEVVTKLKKFYVECKRFDRSADIAEEIRATVRSKVKETISFFLKEQKSIAIDLSIHIAPEDILEEEILKLAQESIERGCTLETERLTVSTRHLRYEGLDTYTLFPSAQYFWNRYKFKNNGEWQGIVTPLIAKFKKFNKNLEGNLSSWLDDVSWECPIRWRVTDKELIWRHKRLGYTRLFKGLDQLQARGDDSVLHVWFERDPSFGHRRNELVDFCSRVENKAKDRFSWIVFNETILDLTIAGRFDFIEHAHFVAGPTHNFEKPLVLNVFSPSNSEEIGGLFGVGLVLPDWDDECKKK